MTDCVICDLDGTIAHPNGRNVYDASTADQDIPDLLVLSVLWAIFYDFAAENTSKSQAIVYVSARPEQYRAPTLKFLKSHAPKSIDGMGGSLHPSGYVLYMRANGDVRKDTVVKRELLDKIRADGYNPVLAIDDRPAVCRMFREQGIKVLQCNDIEF